MPETREWSFDHASKIDTALAELRSTVEMVARRLELGGREPQRADNKLDVSDCYGLAKALRDAFERACQEVTAVAYGRDGEEVSHA